LRIHVKDDDWLLLVSSFLMKTLIAKVKILINK